MPYYDDDTLDSYLFWVLDNECVYKVWVPIYRLNTIYHNMVIGFNTYYGGRAIYVELNDCDIHYILLQTKTTFLPY